MKIFKNRVLFFRWFLSYLVMMGLVMLASIGIYFHSYKLIAKQTEMASMTLLEKIQVEIDGHFSDARKTLSMLMLDSEVQKAAESKAFAIRDREMLYRICEDITNRCASFSDIHHMFIYFKNTDTILSEKGSMDSQFFYQLYYQQEDMSFEAFQTLLRKNWTHDVKTVTNKKGQQEVWVMQSALPRGKDSRGVIGVSFSEKVLKKWMEEMRWDEDEYLLMIHPDGSILGEQQIIESLRKEEYHLEEPTKGTKEIWIGEDVYRMLLVPSKENDYYYMALSPMNKVRKDARSIQLYMVGGLFLCTAVGIIVAYVLTGINYHPIRHLMDLFGNYGKDGRREKKNELQWLLEQSEEVLNDHREIKQRYYNNSQILRGQYLSRIVTLPYDEKSRCARALKEEGCFRDPDNMVLLLYLHGEIDWGQMGNDLYLFILSNVMKELMQEKYSAELVDLRDTVVCVINGVNRSAESREEIDEILDVMQKFVAERMKMRLSVACGGFCCGPEGIYESYLMAREASDYREQMEETSVVWYEDIRNRQVCYEYSIEMEQRIINAIRTGAEENACKWINEVIESNQGERNISAGMKRCLFFELLGTIMKGVEQSDGLEYISEAAVEREFSKLQNSEETKRFFDRMIHEVCEKIRIRKKETSEDTQFGRQVMQYVQENYQNPDLNISITALYFHITPSYLSSLFKEQTGMNLLEYINHTRVERVKELLKEGKSVVDISEETGFRSSQALIRVFKKETGITPGQMRKMNEL